MTRAQLKDQVFDSGAEATALPGRYMHKLRKLCHIIPGHHIDKTHHNRDGKGVPYLTGPSDFGQLQATASRWTDHPDVMCKPLDVLVVVKGSGVANTNFAPDEPACIGRQLMAVRAKHNIADPGYVYFALTSAKHRLKQEAMGATVPGLSIEHLENLEVMAPPFNEQQRIADLLRGQFAEVQKARFAIQKQIEELELIPMKLLAQVFGS